MHVSKHEKPLILLQFSSPQNLPDLGFCQENGAELSKRRIKRDAHFRKSHKNGTWTHAQRFCHGVASLRKWDRQEDKLSKKLRDKQSIACAMVVAALRPNTYNNWRKQFPENCRSRWDLLGVRLFLLHFLQVQSHRSLCTIRY